MLHSAWLVHLPVSFYSWSSSPLPYDIPSSLGPALLWLPAMFRLFCPWFCSPPPFPAEVSFLASGAWAFSSPSLSGETEGRPLPLENRRVGVCADAGLAAQGTDVGLGHRRTRKLCQQRLHAHSKPLLASARIQIWELTLSLLWIHQWLKQADYKVLKNMDHISYLSTVYQRSLAFILNNLFLKVALFSGWGHTGRLGGSCLSFLTREWTQALSSESEES